MCWNMFSLFLRNHCDVHLAFSPNYIWVIFLSQRKNICMISHTASIALRVRLWHVEFCSFFISIFNNETIQVFTLNHYSKLHLCKYWPLGLVICWKICWLLPHLHIWIYIHFLKKNVFYINWNFQQVLTLQSHWDLCRMWKWNASCFMLIAPLSAFSQKHII